MLVKLQKWGNSQGIRLNKLLLTEAQLKVGDEVNVSFQNGQIIIEPLGRIKGKYKLEALLKGHSSEKLLEEEWGHPVGKEEW